MKRLGNKVSIISGAANGIGRGVAGVFAAEGSMLVLVDIDEDAGYKVVRECHGKGAQSVFVKGDVCKREDMQHVAKAAVREFGSIDVVISNAGIFPSQLLADMREEEWDRVLSINLKGTFLLIQACLPQMMSQKYGKIVVTSSITGNLTGYPGWAHYAASKAGLMGFIRTAALELAPYNITINGIQPGNIMTEGMQATGEEYIQKTRESIPMKKLGEPEDIAYAMLFLSTDESRYITGQAIVVDGGQTLPESQLAM